MGPTPLAPISLYRERENLGIWEHRGKVAVAGLGCSPTARRWDEKPETSVGANTIIAVNKALEDAGISPEAIDGLVVVPDCTGEPWATRPIPEDFARTYIPTDNPNDGISSMSADWLVKNMPELNNVTFAMHAPTCMSKAIVVAAQIVGDGEANTVLVVRALNNLSGRYSQWGANALDTAPGRSQWTSPWGWSAAGATYGYLLNKYCRKYGSSHDRMAPFIVNQRRNGLMNPDGFFYQHRPEAITAEDYIAARWLAKPMNLYDADMPIQVSFAYVFTTADRAKDMKQPPVYILNHASNVPNVRSNVQTLDEVEASTDAIARKVFNGSGITASDIDVFNPYDGFTLFTQYYLEGFQWHGVKRGEAHDFWAGDITVEGPHPFSSSGGNTGSGRTRVWLHNDCIQQIRGQAGDRQVNNKAEIAVSGAYTPTDSCWTTWSKYPD